jgi:hypothetical protein
MKTLYESILDDEEVLISNIKKNTGDWLDVLKQLLADNRSEDEILDYLNNNAMKELSKFYIKAKQVYWTCFPNKKDDFVLTDKKGGQIWTKSKSNYSMRIMYNHYLDRMYITLKTYKLPTPAFRNINNDEFLKYAESLGPRDIFPSNYMRIHFSERGGWEMEVEI